MNLSSRNALQTELDLGDHYSGVSKPTFWSKWFGGVILPGIVALYALRCCLLQDALFTGRHGATIVLSGKQAVLYGLAWLSGGFFLHFHYFWPSLKRLGALTDLCKVVSLLCFIGTLGFLAWLILMG